MLGSLTEADDAVQDTWLRLSRAGADEVDNLGGWLTTVVARVCLDMLRARAARGNAPPDEAGHPVAAASPEDEALLADTVGFVRKLPHQLVCAMKGHAAARKFFG